MKTFFSNTSKRLSFFVSLFLMIVLSVALLSSFFLSDLTLNKLAQSNYFQTKISQVLEENDISSKGLLTINFSKYSSADITIEKANLSIFNNVVGHDIKLKVDFIKYLLGLSFIEQVFIKEVIFSLPSDLKVNLNRMSGLDLKSLIHSMSASHSKINSKSIFIEKGTLKFLSQTFNFREIYFLKNETLLTAKASLKANPNSEEISDIAEVNISLNSENIIKFNIESQIKDYRSFFPFGAMPEVVRLFFESLLKNSNAKNKKGNLVKAVGNYNLNTKILYFELADISNRLKLNSNINMLELFKNNNLSITNTEILLGNHSLVASNLYYDFSSRTFKANVTKLVMLHENTSLLPNKFKVFGVFPVEEGIISKINILGDNPSTLQASLEIVESPIGFDNGEAALNFFIKINSLQKFSLSKFGFLLNLFSRENELTLYNANAQISFAFNNNSLELHSFEGKINNLVYFGDNKRLAELEDINFEGNRKQGFAAINSLTKIEPSTDIFRDIKVEFSSIGNAEYEKEITLSLKSNVSGLISMLPKTKYDLRWINSLIQAQGENEVSITYSKEIAFNNIQKFFTFEENMFELNMKNLYVSLNAKNSLSLGALNFKGIGNTIFFEAVMASTDRKISGSINNWLSNIFTEDKTHNLTIFFDHLNSETLFPDFYTFNIKGPMKITFSSVEKDDNVLFSTITDLTEAEVFVPALTLKKAKGKYGQLKLDLTKDKRSVFKYSQNDALVSGDALYKSSFEIETVNYSKIKTPDIRIERATFQKFDEYDQFITSGGVISLEYLMSLSHRKKDIPLNVVFSDINVTFKTNKFLGSLKGEIRSFKGLRGYAKAKVSQNSKLDIIISPLKNNGINLVVSGNNAGELLRKGKYYENGFGGLFKASIFYKNRANISGSLEIEGFRIRNAPVLAQIISSASIIGLLDNLNGNGLLFTKIEGSFDYKDSELTLKDGVAVGPSLGLTMSGYERYGTKQNTVNVNGLVSPVYIINGVVKAIPLIGKVLGGEKGEGLIGVSYKVQGNSRKPRVSVNPLSILTPGLFRRIFNFQENGNM